MAGRFHAHFSSHGSLVYLWLKSRVQLVLSHWLVLGQSWHELACGQIFWSHVSNGYTLINANIR